MLTQKFIKIFYSVQEIGPFSLFQNLALSKASTDDKSLFVIPWARSFQHEIVCKILSKYSKRFKSSGSLFYRIWTSAKPRQIPNVIWQSHGLQLVNTNVYAKFHHNIPLSSEIGPFSLFQNLELGKTSTDEKWHFTMSWLHLVNINVCAKVYQSISLSSRDKAI